MSDSSTNDAVVSSDFDAEVIVVGGGLAGLAAAAFATRAGAKVLVLERTGSVGGRATTHEAGGFQFNVGPHALYYGGPAAEALAELGVRYTGRRPSVSGGLAYHKDELHALPGGVVSLLTTDLLSLRGRLELARLFGSLGSFDTISLRGQTLRQWIDTTCRNATARSLLEALLRVTTYANDPERSCAEAAVAQLKDGLGRGVLYIDGGWTVLASGMRRVAEAAGATVLTGARVRSVKVEEGGVEVVASFSLSESERIGVAEEYGDSSVGALSSLGRELRTFRARNVVLAVPPTIAAAITEGQGSEALRRWAGELIPVKIACLDLGLRKLPDPSRLFVVGIDRPFYFSVHSAAARLAPEGGALVHVAKYLGPEPSDAKAVEAELEAFCDVVQPGWREEVVERRYLPSMMVTAALVEARKRRPGPEVAGVPSLLVAGDWVGGESMIADTAIASGRRAGTLAALRAAAATGRA